MIEKIDNDNVKISTERIINIPELKAQLDSFKQQQAEFERIESLIPKELQGLVRPEIEPVDYSQIQTLEKQIKQYEDLEWQHIVI